MMMVNLDTHMFCSRWSYMSRQISNEHGESFNNGATGHTFSINSMPDLIFEVRR